MKKQSSSMGKIVSVGAGVAALAAAGYCFWGPNGKKNQKATKSWMIKMKGDVVEKLESMEEISKETYDKVVDAASRAYETAAGNKADVEKMAKELKSHWKSIAAKAMKAMPKAKKAVKKTAKPRS